MPEAPVVTAPAEITPPVAPQGADPTPTPDVIPDNVAKLLRNLDLDPDQPSEPKEVKVPDPKPATPDPKASKEPKADPKPGAEAKPGAEPPAAPDIRLRKPKVARPELPLAAPPAAPAAQPSDTPYKPDPQWEAGLDEEQREMLADAQFMEERFPDKYKGWAARTAKFLKEHAEHTAKEDFDPQSPLYKTWLDKNQPRLTRQQIREIEEVRVTDRVRKDYDGKLADVQHQLFVRDHEPKIEAEGRTIFAELSHTSLPDDIAQAIKKDGFEKANEVYALEIETAQNVLTAATEDVTELRRLATKDPATGRPLQAPLNDPPKGDPNDPAFQRQMARFQQHQRLGQMIGYFDDEFKKNASAEQQQRGGKWFVTRDEWNTIRPDQRHRFWTFKLEEYIPMAKANAKTAVQMAIEQRRAQIKKLGWQPPAPKAAPAAPPPKADPPQPTNTPRIAAAVPTPGGSDPVMSEVDARATRLAAQLNR